MLKRRPEYFAVFALSAVAAIGTACFSAILLNTGTPALSGTGSENAAGIVSRASDLIGVDSDKKVSAQMCVRYGTVSTGVTEEYAAIDPCTEYENGLREAIIPAVVISQAKTRSR